MSPLSVPKEIGTCAQTKGQATVEFTFVFILLLVVAWIPADFGLAFYTGQLAQNTSREGARIAAAEPSLATQVPLSCTLPCSGQGDLLTGMANRMSSALLPGAALSVNLTAGPACNRVVTARVEGTYNFFFYRLLGWFGVYPPNTVNVVRQTTMRWEHQC